MNTTAQASECRRVSRALSDEARHWHGQRRSDMLKNALQLAYTARALPRLRKGVAEAVIAAGLVVVDLAILERAQAEYRVEVQHG